MIYGSVAGVFRSIANADWGVKSDGDVESPTGYFAVVEIPEHAGERAEMRDAVFSDDAEEAEVFDTVSAGWYFVVQATDGSIYVTACTNKADADQRFSNMEEALSLYMTAE